MAQVMSVPALNSVTASWAVKVLLPELGVWATMEPTDGMTIGTDLQVRIVDVGLSIRPELSLVPA